MQLANISNPRLESPTAGPARGARPGLSTIELTAALLIVALVVMVGYRFRPRHEHSPFALFGATPGMALTELREAVTKKGGTVECHRDFDVYQYCAVKYAPDPGFVGALVDPAGRVIVLHATAVVGLDGLETEARSAQAAWSQLAHGVSAPPLVEAGDTGAVRWTSRNSRWTAELHYSVYRDPEVPSQAILVDTKGVTLLASQSPESARRLKENGWIPPTAEEALASFETQKEERESKYEDMSATLNILRDREASYRSGHQSYTDNASELAGMSVAGSTNLEILTATDSGWTARATHPSFPGLSCVASGGRVPADDWPITAHGKRITWVEGAVCDSLPPMPTPSIGRPQ